jgi:cytochrome c oxidase subunit 1
MFTSGQSELAAVLFSFMTFLVAIPSGVKVFNWLATLYKGSIHLATPMLYALTFLFTFTIGGLTGMFLGTLSVDVHLHDTYFVVAHFHYVMMGGTVMALLAGIHYWWPKMFGKMYSEFWGKIACGIVFVGFNMTFFTQFILGSKGMPRRYHNYLDQYQPLHAFSSVGAWVLGLGFLIMFIYLIHSLFRGRPAGNNPWGTLGFEWETTSPPPPENFLKDPVVSHGPYDYDKVLVHSTLPDPEVRHAG